MNGLNVRACILGILFCFFAHLFRKSFSCFIAGIDHGAVVGDGVATIVEEFKILERVKAVGKEGPPINVSGWVGRDSGNRVDHIRVLRFGVDILIA